jgi:hypothetical protein
VDPVSCGWGPSVASLPQDDSALGCSKSGGSVCARLRARVDGWIRRLQGRLCSLTTRCRTTEGRWPRPSVFYSSEAEWSGSRLLTGLSEVRFLPLEPTNLGPDSAQGAQGGRNPLAFGEPFDSAGPHEGGSVTQQAEARLLPGAEGVRVPPEPLARGRDVAAA